MVNLSQSDDLVTPETPVHGTQQQQQQHLFQLPGPGMTPMYPTGPHVHGVPQYLPPFSPFGQSAAYYGPSHPGPYYSSVPPTPTPTSRHSTPQIQPENNFLTNSEGNRMSPRHYSTAAEDEEEVTVTKAKPVKSKSTRKTGKGARSGTNARKNGTSDDEIKKLPDDIKSAAGIKKPGRASWDPEEEKRVLAYILDPKRWQDFPVNQKEVLIHVN